MKAIAPPNIDAEILEQVVQSDTSALPPALARALLKLSFTEPQRKEIETLLDRNNVGKITNREREQLAGYVRVGNFLSLLQAKARASLSRKIHKR